MDLNKEIQIATDKVIKEKLPQMVEEKVSKMMEGVLEDIFRSYSDTTKGIKEKIEKSLDISLANFNITEYNVLVAKTVAKGLQSQINLKPIEDLVSKIVGVSNKKTITLSEILEKVKELAMAEYSNEHEGSGEVTFEIEENDERKWVEVYCDVEPDKGKNSNLRFIYSTDRNTIFSMSTSNFYGANKEFSPSTLIGISDLEAYIFNIYANQIRIETDDIYFDKEWSRYN